MYRNSLQTCLFKWLTSVFWILETEYLRKVLYFLPPLYHAFFVRRLSLNNIAPWLEHLSCFTVLFHLFYCLHWLCSSLANLGDFMWYLFFLKVSAVLGPGGFPGNLVAKNPPPVQEVWVWSLGREDPLQEGMAAHPRILAWRIPWTEETGGLQSTGSQSQTRWSENVHARK